MGKTNWFEMCKAKIAAIRDAHGVVLTLGRSGNYKMVYRTIFCEKAQGEAGRQLFGDDNWQGLHDKLCIYQDGFDTKLQMLEKTSRFQRVETDALIHLLRISVPRLRTIECLRYTSEKATLLDRREWETEARNIEDLAKAMAILIEDRRIGTHGEEKLEMADFATLMQEIDACIAEGFGDYQVIEMLVQSLDGITRARLWRLLNGKRIDIMTGDAEIPKLDVGTKVNPHTLFQSLMLPYMLDSEVEIKNELTEDICEQFDGSALKINEYIASWAKPAGLSMLTYARSCQARRDAEGDDRDDITTAFDAQEPIKVGVEDTRIFGVGKVGEPYTTTRKDEMSEGTEIISPYSEDDIGV